MPSLCRISYLVALLLAGVLLAGGIPAHAQVTSYPTGWNLVAGPEGSHLVGASDPLYTYRAGDTSYESVPVGSALHACWGYWAYFPTGGSLDMTGSTPRAQCSLAPTAGAWIMVGNPANGGGGISGADVAYTYSPTGGYTSASVIAPGQGVWVSSAGTATLAGQVFAQSAPVVAPVAAPAPVVVQPAPVAASPATAPTIVAPLSVPFGATAICNDGTYSFSQTASGTCSDHGGVQFWFSQPASSPSSPVGPSAPAPAPSGGSSGGCGSRGGPGYRLPNGKCA